jgi:murein DD-endopeptidase MepM/ murein hydrolase activator NlpD
MEVYLFSLHAISSRVLWGAATTLIAVAILLPLPRAVAADDPPFEIRFPQEIQVTTFASTFGARRSGGRRHHGVDLMAPKMTQVYAAAAGYVARVETHSLAGRYLEIAHVAGWSTRYVHLNNDTPGTDDGDADWSLTLAPGVHVGAWIEAGQLIAWVGDSGNAEWSGSHTHFELVIDGSPIDPYPFLKEARERDRERYDADILGLDHRLDLHRMF